MHLSSSVCRRKVFKLLTLLLFCRFWRARVVETRTVDLLLEADRRRGVKRPYAEYLIASVQPQRDETGDSTNALV